MKRGSLHRKSRLHTEQKRICGLAVFFVLVMLAVLYRCFYYQVMNREPWVRDLLAQGQNHKIIKAQRGLIYDRNLKVLAMDMPVTELAVDPAAEEELKVLACSLQTVLGGEQGHYLSIMERAGETRYVPVQAGLSEYEKKRLQRAGFASLIIKEVPQRVRPGGDLALQLLGVIRDGGEGAWGIEQQFGDKLAGTDGWAVEQKDGLNRSHESLDLPMQKPQAGHDVILTIDHAVQTVVEEELAAGVAAFRARYGTAVLIDPFTGEILAMASIVGRGGKQGETGFNDRLKNRAVQWSFEPGSVFKIVTLAAALEEKMFDAKSLIFCENGSYRVANHVINDHEESFAWLTLNQVMEHSSNIGIAKVGQTLGSKLMYKYIRDFGFGNKTGVGLPGEAGGILRPVYQWTSFSPVSISFGQEMSATPLQLVSMAAAVANGGELLQPRVVSRIAASDGAYTRVSQRRVIRRVVSEQTAQQITDVLVNVVERGSGALAAVEGMEIAGKTGTAQKSAPGYRGYMPDAAVCSFIGFWPARAPMYAMIVVLDEPEIHSWGSKSAAPLFGRIVARVSGLPAAQHQRSRSLTAAQPEVPGVIYAAVKDEPAQKSSMVSGKPLELPESQRHIPRLTGLSVRQAMMKLAELEISAKISGNGVVTGQEPRPGTRITAGMTCRLICRSRPEEF